PRLQQVARENDATRDSALGWGGVSHGEAAGRSEARWGQRAPPRTLGGGPDIRREAECPQAAGWGAERMRPARQSDATRGPFGGRVTVARSRRAGAAASARTAAGSRASGSAAAA